MCCILLVGCLVVESRSFVAESHESDARDILEVERAKGSALHGARFAAEKCLVCCDCVVLCMMQIVESVTIDLLLLSFVVDCCMSTCANSNNTSSVKVEVRFAYTAPHLRICFLPYDGNRYAPLFCV